MDEVILHLQLRSLGVEHALKIDRAFLILDNRQFHRPACGGYGILLRGGCFERFEEPYDAILHFLRRLEYAVLICDENLLKSCVLDAHSILGAAIVEDLPIDARTHRKEQAGGIEEVE